MFPKLDRYQQEAYWALMKIARQHGGAFLCDGVGLGKTFVGLMLIERLVLHEGKRVVLFAPEGGEGGGLGAAAPRLAAAHRRRRRRRDFSNLAVFSHTDLGRKGDFPERFERIAELADAVIIDEAHHFRNPGRAGDRRRGRASRATTSCSTCSIRTERPKSLFLLTATPINNRLTDFRHMVELFSRRRRGATSPARSAINNLRAHFSNLEKALRKEFDGDERRRGREPSSRRRRSSPTSPIFQELVVQRSRAYARASQIRETGEAAAFPEREAAAGRRVLDPEDLRQAPRHVETAFSRSKPLFSARRSTTRSRTTRATTRSIDPIEENRQYQVVGLIRTNFLKRFESSVWAFERSCDRLLEKLLAFVEVHSETDAEKKRLERWKLQNAEILGYATQLTLELWTTTRTTSPTKTSSRRSCSRRSIELDRDEYDVDEILDETFLDLDQIVDFLEETRKFEPKHDDKLKKLIRLLKSKELADEKVLIFTEFADTARYLAKQLDEAGIDGRRAARQRDARRTAPTSSSASRPTTTARARPSSKRDGKDEIRVLVSTDVLSEGLNLQDATRLINYDIHWNPVRLMQRIGRVDRRMNPEVEERLVGRPPRAGRRPRDRSSSGTSCRPTSSTRSSPSTRGSPRRRC